MITKRPSVWGNSNEEKKNRCLFTGMPIPINSLTRESRQPTDSKAHETSEAETRKQEWKRPEIVQASW